MDVCRDFHQPCTCFADGEALFLWSAVGGIISEPRRRWIDGRTVKFTLSHALRLNAFYVNMSFTENWWHSLAVYASLRYAVFDPLHI